LSRPACRTLLRTAASDSVRVMASSQKKPPPPPALGVDESPGGGGSAARWRPWHSLTAHKRPAASHAEAASRKKPPPGTPPATLSPYLAPPTTPVVAPSRKPPPPTAALLIHSTSPPRRSYSGTPSPGSPSEAVRDFLEQLSSDDEEDDALLATAGANLAALARRERAVSQGSRSLPYELLSSDEDEDEDDMERAVSPTAVGSQEQPYELLSSDDEEEDALTAGENSVALPADAVRRLDSEPDPAVSHVTAAFSKRPYELLSSDEEEDALTAGTNSVALPADAVRRLDSEPDPAFSRAAASRPKRPYELLSSDDEEDALTTGSNPLALPAYVAAASRPKRPREKEQVVLAAAERVKVRPRRKTPTPPMDDAKMPARPLHTNLAFDPQLDCLVNPGQPNKMMPGTVFFRDYVDRHMEDYLEAASRSVFRYQLVLRFKRETRRRFFFLSEDKKYVLATDPVAANRLIMVFTNRAKRYRGKHPSAAGDASLSKSRDSKSKGTGGPSKGGADSKSKSKAGADSKCKPKSKSTIAPLKVDDRCAVRLLANSPVDHFGRRKLEIWVPGLVVKTVLSKKPDHLTVNVNLDTNEPTTAIWTAGPTSSIQRLIKFPNGMEYLEGSRQLCREPAPADLQVGDAVLAWYQHGHSSSSTFYYEGRVASVDGRTCSVAYDDGDWEEEIPFLQKAPQPVLIRIAKGHEYPDWLVGMSVPMHGEEGIIKSIKDGVVVLRVGFRQVERPYEDVASRIMAQAKAKASSWILWPNSHALEAVELPATDPSADDVPADDVPADDVPADDVPAPEMPAPEMPAVEMPAVEIPLPIAEIPTVETRTVETRTVETHTVETRTVETRTVETRTVETPTTPVPPPLQRQKSMSAQSGFILGRALNSSFSAWGADILNLTQSHRKRDPNRFLQGEIDELLLNGPMAGETAFPDSERMDVVNEVAKEANIPWAKFWVKVTEDLYTASDDELRTTDAALKRITASFHVKTIAAERLLQRVKNAGPNSLAEEIAGCPNGSPGTFPGVIGAIVSLWSKYSHFHIGTGWETNDGTTIDARSMVSHHTHKLFALLGVLVSYAGKAYGARFRLDATGLANFISGRIRLSPSVEAKHLKPCSEFPAGLTTFDYMCMVKLKIVLGLDDSLLPGVKRQLAQRLGVFALYEPFICD
jgi:hypothetical protein